MLFRFKPIAVAAGLMGLVSSDVLMAENDWIKGVSVDGLLKIAAVYGNDYYEKDTSDIIVHTAILGINAQLNQWASGRFSYKYEENKTDLSVDDGYITLGDHANGLPAYLRMGQFVVPFGNFTSHMNSDPLTLVMGESAEKAVQLGFNASGAYGSVFGYNGATQDDNNDTIDHYGGNIGFAKDMGQFSVDVGVSYLSDFGDTGTLSAALEPAMMSPLSPAYDYVAGLGAHLIVKAGPAFFIGEYITALDPFEPEYLAFKGEGAEPQVWNTEAGLTFNMAGQELTLALGYQATEEAVGLMEPRASHLPESRILGTVAMEIYENTTVSIEYAVSEDYDVEDGGTGEDAESASLVLAVEF